VYPARRKGWNDPKGFALLTIFVYGFNNDEEDEWDRWGDKTWPGIERQITPHSDGGTTGRHGIILFSWPGDSAGGKILSGLQYAGKIRPAIKSGVELAKYLKKIAPLNENLHVQFVGHSLGCRVVLSAVEQLAARPQEVPVVRVLLMGAAVPEGDCTGHGPWPTKAGDLFSAAQSYEVASSSDVIMHSDTDQVLGRKFIAGELLAQRFLKVKSYGSPRAVGRTGGPSTDRWTGVVRSSRLGHSQYLTDPTALAHVANLFGTLAYRPLPGSPAGTRPLDEQRMGSRQLASARRMG
jgi:hypothetical protein